MAKETEEKSEVSQETETSGDLSTSVEISPENQAEQQVQEITFDSPPAAVVSQICQVCGYTTSIYGISPEKARCPACGGEMK